MVDDLNALTVVIGVRRIGTPVGDSVYTNKTGTTPRKKVQASVSTNNVLLLEQDLQLLTELRPWMLSRRMRAASADTSSLDPTEPAPCLIDDESETPDVAIPVPEKFREIGRGMFPSRGLPAGLPLMPCVDESDVVRAWPGVDVLGTAGCGGITKRSAMERGGEVGSDVRRGRLPGDPEILSRCWFLMSVGVKSGPSSRKREERRDSRVSN